MDVLAADVEDHGSDCADRQADSLGRRARTWLAGLLKPRNAVPYHGGYDAFYSGSANPHPDGSDMHAEWQLGYEAAASDFEW